MDSADEKDRSRERSRRGDRPSRFTETSRDRSTDRGRDRGGMKTSNCRVYVSNIPYEFRWQDLKDLFRTEVGDVQFAELFLDDNDKSRGCGIVEFVENASVKKCLEVMQRFEVKGRKLVIKEDGGNLRDKHGNIVGNKRGRDEGRFHREDRFDSQQSLINRAGGGGGGGGGGDDGKWGNTYGLSPNFLESLRIDVPLCNRVFVANLEYNVDKKKIKEVFRLAGKIQRVDLQRDKDGRSRGFAVVEFDHPVEAVQAISMFNNQFLFDRQMTVRMDRSNEVSKLPEGLKGVGMGLGTNGEPLKDVARNLPSNNNGNQGTVGAGILGAVPNSALQVANALSGLNNIGPSSFGNLAGNPGVLQAANLAGVNSLTGNLLGSGLGGSDLSLAASTLVQNQNQLAAFAGGNSLNSGGNSNVPPFGRNDNSFGSGQNYNNSRNYQGSFDSNKPFGNFGNDRDNSFNSVSSGNQLMRSNNPPNAKSSRKILVSNLPPSASYKMLHDKFSEFGEVLHFEEKSSGTMLVMYSVEWQAERAIKSLDRARIDGRTIDARFYY